MSVLFFFRINRKLSTNLVLCCVIFTTTFAQDDPVEIATKEIHELLLSVEKPSTVFEMEVVETKTSQMDDLALEHEVLKAQKTFEELRSAGNQIAPVTLDELRERMKRNAELPKTTTLHVKLDGQTRFFVQREEPTFPIDRELADSESEEQLKYLYLSSEEQGWIVDESAEQATSRSTYTLEGSQNANQNLDIVWMFHRLDPVVQVLSLGEVSSAYIEDDKLFFSYGESKETGRSAIGGVFSRENNNQWYLEGAFVSLGNGSYGCFFTENWKSFGTIERPTKLRMIVVKCSDDVIVNGEQESIENCTLTVDRNLELLAYTPDATFTAEDFSYSPPAHFITNVMDNSGKITLLTNPAKDKADKEEALRKAKKAEELAAARQNQVKERLQQGQGIARWSNVFYGLAIATLIAGIYFYMGSRKNA